MNKVFIAALLAWMISPNVYFTSIDLHDQMQLLEGDNQWK